MSRRKPHRSSAPPEPVAVPREPEAARSTPARVRVLVGAVAGGLLLLGLGVAIGVRLGGARDVQACRMRFTHLNAVVACGDGPVLAKRGYDAFRDSLRSVLRERRRLGVLGDASVYFRDLANGPIFGIDENAQFVPASLLKLPLVLAYLAIEEDTPGFVARQIVYEGDGAVPVQTIGPSVTLRPGEPYPIETLLANTLRFSDNTAYLVLRQHLRSLDGGDALLLQTYRELGIVNPNDPLDETMTVRGYASLFRILYNASYLRAELSERALAWLSESDFRDGLVGGVPPGTVVAHKFGERDLSGGDAAGRWQFHDCGIVYYPRNSYLLCVMTRGSDLRQLVDAVRLVSQLVYDEVASRERAARGTGHARPGR